ncbi:hypothetical protein POM88_030554 [Heracleum sosnowskyi]|uniref:Protein kinase domain-containing protein n=1 Tax=Heracleum sosnowskyi TaxID=360622 RepID=A0AAD8HW50_9APIA|nr:hypothetical protein POM88_030554 [Heracleum sosnowskyi]
MASTEIELFGSETIYHVLNELYVTNRCCRHDNILDCKSTVQNRKILVSFESSKSLDSFSLFQQGCKEEFVSYVMMGTLAALDCIHASGNRVHRKINENTVFLDKNCRVKLEFPTRISNPDLEYNAKTLISPFAKEIDIKMVGDLACSLYHGKSQKKKLSEGGRSTLPVLLQDFVNCCVGRSPTISKLMDHALFKQFNEFDRYQQELKELLE